MQSENWAYGCRVWVDPAHGASRWSALTCGATARRISLRQGAKPLTDIAGVWIPTEAASDRGHRAIELVAGVPRWSHCCGWFYPRSMRKLSTNISEEAYLFENRVFRCTTSDILPDFQKLTHSYREWRHLSAHIDIGIKIRRWALVQIYSRDVGVCCKSWGRQGRSFATNTHGEAINLHQGSAAGLNGYYSEFEW